MSLISLFTKQAPTLGVGDGAIEFDAVIEDTLEAEVTYTKYPIELGANASDHAIVEPVRYVIVGAISNNPVKIGVMDFAAGAVSNLFDSGLASAVLGNVGAIAGYLGGSEKTRAQDTIDKLLELMRLRKPFSVSAGDTDLENMVITKISRTKTAANEGGLEFRAELQELPTIELAVSRNSPKQDQLRKGTPESTQAAADVNHGEVTGKSATVDLGAVR